MEMSISASIQRMENRYRRHRYPHFTQKLWAYLTIKKLLDSVVKSVDENVKANAKQQALDLSLKVFYLTVAKTQLYTVPCINFYYLFCKIVAILWLIFKFS